jgi:hypothetical protein
LLLLLGNAMPAVAVHLVPNNWRIKASYMGLTWFLVMSPCQDVVQSLFVHDMLCVGSLVHCAFSCFMIYTFHALLLVDGMWLCCCVQMGLMAGHLRVLRLDGNSLRTIRRPILEKGTAALLDWLKNRIPM